MPILFNEHEEKLPHSLVKLIVQLQHDTSISLNEYLFVCVLYNILECGFILSHRELDYISTYDYNIQSIDRVGDFNLRDIYLSDKNQFTAKLRLGPKCDRSSEIYLTGHPSRSILDEYMVVNLRTIPHNEVTSICILTKQFGSQLRQGIVDDRSTLSLLIKNNLAWPIKSFWMLRNLQGCFPHYAALPDHVMDRILSYKSKAENLPFRFFTAKSY